MESKPRVDQTDDLLRVFIGDNYDKITTKKFNFAGFFFTSFYMFYRKMFLYGLLVFILNLFVLNFVKLPAINLIFNVLVGLFVNKIYLSYANNKINEIKANNQQRSLDELKVICLKRGGVSFGFLFLGFLVEFLVVLAIIIVFGISIIGSALSSIVKGVFNSGNGTFDGTILYDTNVIIKDEFTVLPPLIFDDESDDSTYSYVIKSGEGIFDECRIFMGAVKGYKDASDFINQVAEYNKDSNPTAVSTVSMNHVDWYWFSTDDSLGTTYYYGTTKKNKVYLLKYEIQNNAVSECDSYRMQTLASIESK